MGDKLLQVDHLKKYFPVRAGARGAVRAVDDVSFHVYPQETFGFVGESGCGKSTLARAALGLTKADGGQVIFQGVNLFALGPRQMRRERANIQMVFQKPFESLNPRKTIGQLVREPLDIHTRLRRAQKEDKARALLDQVGIQPDKADCYPHQFSGGQRQRIAIARAIILKPKLVVCDEAVSALDVSIQAQILNLLMDLQREYGLTYIFISHNLSVVKHVSDRIGVMYLGKLVEVAPKEALYKNPLHPYTVALIGAIPAPDPGAPGAEPALSGDLPSPLDPLRGCRFCTRCPWAQADCFARQPAMAHRGGGHYVACHRYQEAGGGP